MRQIVTWYGDGHGIDVFPWDCGITTWKITFHVTQIEYKLLLEMGIVERQRDNQIRFWYQHHCLTSV